LVGFADMGTPLHVPETCGASGAARARVRIARVRMGATRELV
jgi:hypothetical protein